MQARFLPSFFYQDTRTPILHVKVFRFGARNPVAQPFLLALSAEAPALFMLVISATSAAPL